MKKIKKPLSLQTQTVRVLQDLKLADVGGGRPSDSRICPSCNISHPNLSTDPYC